MPNVALHCHEKKLRLVKGVFPKRQEVISRLRESELAVDRLMEVRKLLAQANKLLEEYGREESFRRMDMVKGVASQQEFNQFYDEIYPDFPISLPDALQELALEELDELEEMLEI